jgi:hypothetical protein
MCRRHGTRSPRCGLIARHAPLERYGLPRFLEGWDHTLKGAAEIAVRASLIVFAAYVAFSLGLSMSNVRRYSYALTLLAVSQPWVEPDRPRPQTR